MTAFQSFYYNSGLVLKTPVIGLHEYVKKCIFYNINSAHCI